jgi:hypothetical protein
MVVPGKHKVSKTLTTIEWMSCSKTTDMCVKVIFTKFSAKRILSSQPTTPLRPSNDLDVGYNLVQFKVKSANYQTPPLVSIVLGIFMVCS